jgi:hypothetical protein
MHAALDSAHSRIARLISAGFALSRNDRKIIHYRQLLTTLATARDVANFASFVATELALGEVRTTVIRDRPHQQVLFEEV